MWALGELRFGQTEKQAEQQEWKLGWTWATCQVLIKSLFLSLFLTNTPASPKEYLSVLLDSEFLNFLVAAPFAAFPLGNCPAIILPWSFPNTIAREPAQGTLRHAEPGSERALTHTGNRPSVSLQSLGQTVQLFRRYQIDWPPGAHSDGHFNNSPLDGLL